MSTSVHSLAIVEDGAQLGQNVVVEAFALIGKNAILGDGTIIRHHATVEGKSTLGKNNEVYPYALIGGLTHDLKYSGGEPGLVIGDNNTFREYVTAHVATDGNDCTVIGSDNVFLAYSHVAHDCKVGNHLVMSSQSALGGHVEVADHVNIGWGVGVHQFCRLGRHCMISACSKLVQDVPPFMLADGSPAEVRSINKVGMERTGFTKTDLDVAKGVFKVLYRGDLNRRQAVKHLQNGSNLAAEKITQEIIQFTELSNRGIA
ncbi:MAG: acyl-ACP--UDP-N-acetylglucosamine O-acyltransferase [Opitutales bacterium]|nr:acyl-ACP--UDP-N-acetylglucosamine O-acyltransferase [Opitutales bacterium]MDG1325269.1 acyl-ACP--UDP-N-acetylglucosamine O-acyltransferase [Opitutales bacterium]